MEPARLAATLQAAMGEPTRKEPESGDCTLAVAGKGLSPRGLVNASATRLAIRTAASASNASVLAEAIATPGRSPEDTLILPPSGEAVLGEPSAARTAMGSVPAGKFPEYTGEAVRDICPCARTAAMAEAALEVPPGVGEVALLGCPGGGGYTPEKLVAADAPASCEEEEEVRKVTGTMARGLSSLFDIGGLAITAPGPDGDLGGEICLHDEEEVEPPAGGDCGRTEPAEDLAETGPAAAVLIEPPEDRHGPIIAKPRFGVDRHTTTGRGREEEDEEAEVTPWGIVGTATTGVATL